MKHLVIIGAGGMGRSLVEIAKNSIGYGDDFDIKGFIDDDDFSLEGFEGYPKLLGTIDGYNIQENDIFACSIGNMQTKRTICEMMKEKGAKFQTLINNTAMIYKNAKIGEGSIIAEFTVIGNDSIIGENSLVQTYSDIGHDCIIGDYVRIDTHCTCVGGIRVCDGATIHTSSIINHGVTVGENAIVGAMSFVIRKVKPETTVCGNPARKLDF